MKLFFSFKGTIGREAFWRGMFITWLVFALVFAGIQNYIGTEHVWVLYPFFFWSMLALMTKRYRDREKSVLWSLLLLIPIVGPFIVFFELGFLKEKR